MAKAKAKVGDLVKQTVYNGCGVPEIVEITDLIEGMVYFTHEGELCPLAERSYEVVSIPISTDAPQKYKLGQSVKIVAEGVHKDRIGTIIPTPSAVGEIGCPGKFEYWVSFPLDMCLYGFNGGDLEGYYEPEGGGLDAPTNVRCFSTGATRDTDQNKYDYEGFLSPLVIEKYGEYMNKHRKQSDGSLRDSDNWQKGFGDEHFNVCMKSLWRHFLDLWMEHRGHKCRETIDEAICGLLFNAMAYYHQLLLKKGDGERKVSH